MTTQDAGMRERAYVAVGSNVGDRAAALRHAAAAIAALPEVRHLRGSRLYATPALRTDGLGTLDDPDAFLNAVLSFETTFKPEDLLAALLGIEAAAGRQRQADRTRWAPRPLDLDLLLLGDQQVDRPGLTLPHPRITQRWFVLAPLQDLAPDLKLAPAPAAADAQPQQQPVRDWLAAIAWDSACVGEVVADATWVTTPR
jgi:2-amino-4-hydroxy-6-hydroxymethyldihydropteridine diphosphokinase